MSLIYYITITIIIVIVNYYTVSLYFLVPLCEMNAQGNRDSGCFPQGNQAAIAQRYLAFFSRVSIPLDV